MTQMVTRRDFLKILNRLLVVTGLTVVLGPIIAYFYPPELEETPTEPVPVGLLADLPPGTSQTVRYGRYPALIIHTPAGLRAYSAVCTHFACLVKWDPTRKLISCPCHDGFFAAEDGHVISGPPPSPLVPLPVTVKDGQIHVGGEA